MRSVILALLLTLLTACSSGSPAEPVPFASFAITAATPSDANETWDKARACLLANGFAFFKNSGSDSKTFVLRTDQHVSVMLSKRSSFVEVVMMQTSSPHFTPEDKIAYENLKEAMERCTSGQISESIPFTTE